MKTHVIGSYLLLCGLTINCGQQDKRVAEESQQTESVTSIADTVKLINTLDKPLTIETLIRTISSEIKVLSTYSQFSAQPSLGITQPRIFLKINNKLILSVVPGEDSLELGEIATATTSKKGDLSFPIEKNIEEQDPFQIIFVDDGDPNRTCGFVCHTPVKNDRGDFLPLVSKMILPKPGEVLSLSELKDLASNCNETSKVCAMYQAIFTSENIGSFTFEEIVVDSEN